MDKINLYKKAIKQILLNYVATEEDKSQFQVVIDEERNHYYLVHVGWSEEGQIHNCIFHFDIIKDKLWVQRNQTDWDLMEDFEEVGITKKDIVAGFLPPDVRPFTPFAVG